jgi:parallel beta-helix repeat protein
MAMSNRRSLLVISSLCVSGGVALLCGLVVMLFLRPLPVSSSSLSTAIIDTDHNGSSPVSSDLLTIEVTSTAYDGPGSLRQALWLAIPGTTISFSPVVFPPDIPATIVVTETLQFWTNRVTVDASDAGVILDGSQARQSVNGFELYNDECVLQGLTIRGFPGNGIQVVKGADKNTIDGNLIVLSGVDGIKIQGNENTVQGNIIGVDPGRQGDFGNRAIGITLTGGATGNVIGGTGAGQRNVISGNGQDGVYIGGTGTTRNRVTGNMITANLGDGILVASCGGNAIARNSIYGNEKMGIREVSHCLDAPIVTAAAVGTDEVVTGETVPGALVEVFSDAEDEGRFYEGNTTADIQGRFRFTATGGFRHPNVTATATDDAGNTSEFSLPAHLLWTLLLYLNGDNDLHDAIFETLDNLVRAGPSPQANVLALVDGHVGMARSDTVLYDLTRGQATRPTDPFTTTAELNMGDEQTLVDFVTWGRAYAPARHTLLAIVDHGGGWAPSSSLITGGLLRRADYLGGNSGLSWDYTSGYDYLDSRKIREALAAITGNGAAPLDVVFYDVCLMGMLEVAYQIKDYAGFFVSSQNIGWLPTDADGRYVRTIQEILPTTTPEDLAKLLVRAYAESLPVADPFTVSAVKLASLPGTVDAVKELALAIIKSPELPVSALYQAYAGAQKLDYDTDFQIEPETDGIVDLYDFALHAGRTFTQTNISAAAQRLATELDKTIVANRKRSGMPPVELGAYWDLEDVHGLSVYLPLGEDLILPIVVTETSSITPGLAVTRNLHLREMYTCDQLQFVCATDWDKLINAYYTATSSVPSFVRAANTPLKGLQDPRPVIYRRLWLPLIVRGS